MSHEHDRISKNSQILRSLDGDWWRIALIWLLTMLLRYGLLSCLVLPCANNLFAQQRVFGKDRFHAGEVLTYKVKWSFFRLGTVVFRQELIDSIEKTRFLLSMDVQSAKGLPFIDVQFLNQSVVSPLSPGLSSEDIFARKDRRDRTTYWYDSTSQKIVMVDSSDGKLVRMDSVFTRYPCYDALNLFMFARQHAGLDTTVMLPTVNDYEVKSTVIRFTRELEDLAVDALPGSVRARKFDGNAQWVGKSFAGMKGPFRGWVSDDEAAVPLRAEIEIFLGSIVMELESYERTSWYEGRSTQQAAIYR